MAPSRMDLQAMDKKSSETFNQPRDLAAQVQPPLTEVSIFISTLRAPYYDKMLSNASRNLSDLVITGERIDEGIRTGKITDPTTEAVGSKKSTGGKKKEGEVQAISQQMTRFRPNTPGGSNIRPRLQDGPLYQYIPFSSYRSPHTNVNSLSQPSYQSAQVPFQPNPRPQAPAPQSP